MMSKFFLVVLLVIAVKSEENSIPQDEYFSRIKFQPPLPPVLLVPGIGGSILYADTPTDKGRRVWKTWSSPDYDTEFLVGFKYNVYTKYDDFGLYAIERLDYGNLAYESSKYFAEIIKYFKKIGYIPGTNLFGFPYDWRKSIRNISSEQKLNELIKTYKPVVISHSMGGLVIEDFIRTYGDSNIRAWICIGCPFKGVGGDILKAFIDGYPFWVGNTRLSDSVAKRVVLESYSAYELLPQPSLYSQPKVIVDDMEWDWKSYLTKIPSFKIERITTRTPITLTTKTFFIANSGVGTPFNYNIKTKSFSVTQGDGTVPINSAWGDIESSNLTKIDINTSSLDHLTMLFSFIVFDKLSIYSGNECLLKGTYVGETDLLVFDNGTNLNGIQIDGTNYHDDCIHIEYNTKIYTRNIGMQCDKYSTSTSISDDGLLIRTECIYGYNYNTISEICNTSQTYDKNTSRCVLITQETSSSFPKITKIAEDWEIGVIASLVALLMGLVIAIVSRKIYLLKKREEPPPEIEDKKPLLDETKY